ESVVFASESCALDAMGAVCERELEPGEVVVVTDDGVQSIKTHCGGKSSFCVFEFIYFARPDSVINGTSVHEARKRAGALLAKSHPVDADVVIGVPDSGLDAAVGYSEKSGIPFEIGFLKNKYIGRTFIAPSQKQRETDVRIKLNPISSTIEGKRVVLVDDSIVRGTTCLKTIKMIREAGAKEIHFRLSSPPFKYPCYFGTDISSSEFLIAYKYSLEEIRKMLGVDSLGFLSVEDLQKLSGDASWGMCNGCFTGEYPIKPPERCGKSRFETRLSENTAD
ncbi:MAG: amidophosphoribosyltransferase, partial [Oscillospiraceae bacterium]